METPPTPLIKIRNNYNSEKYFAKLKLHRDTTSEKLNLCKFKMALFDNVELEEFLLFVHNFNMTLEASETLETDAKF